MVIEPRPQIKEWKNPDYEPIYAWRNRNYRMLRKGGQPAWDAAFSYYQEHPVEAIEAWVTTYDPRLANRGVNPYVPFILFPLQRECVLWMWDLYKKGTEGVIEKTRDCGISWLTIAFAWWLWTFHFGVQVGFGSRKENLVDHIGDPDSLLQKMRILLEKLPDEIKPIGWKTNEDQPHRRIKNRETKSNIIGQGGREIGRGGRSTIYFVDEAAFLEYPDDAEAALSLNADAKIWVSTPNGTGNPFYRKRFSGNFPVFTFFWTDDPRKDQAWYDEKKRTLEPEVLAREVDLDYEASGGDMVIPALWVKSSRALTKQLRKDGMLPDVPKNSGIAGLDVAAGGAAKSVLIPRYGTLVGKSTSWSDADTTDVAGKAADAATAADCWLVKFDSIGVGRGVSAAFRRMDGVRAQGVNVGDRPTRTRWPDKKRAKDKFVNLKAELWWVVRDGLRRTYEHWLHYNGEGGVQHDADDLILLPDDNALAAELSLPRYFYTEAGKIQIESKRQMAARGVASPDHAESVILTYAPRPVRRGSRRVVGLW